MQISAAGICFPPAKGLSTVLGEPSEDVDPEQRGWLLGYGGHPLVVSIGDRMVNDPRMDTRVLVEVIKYERDGRFWIEGRADGIARPEWTMDFDTEGERDRALADLNEMLDSAPGSRPAGSQAEMPKLCPYCECSLDMRSRKTAIAHVTNCIAREWCTRCGSHKGAHGLTSVKRRQGRIAHYVCERFVAPRPKRPHKAPDYLTL